MTLFVRRRCIAIAASLLVGGVTCAQTDDKPSWLNDPQTRAQPSHLQGPATLELPAPVAESAAPSSYTRPENDSPRVGELPDEWTSETSISPSSDTQNVAKDSPQVGELPDEWLNETAISLSNDSPNVTAESVRQYVRTQLQASPMADDYQPWWETATSEPFQLSKSSIVVDGDELILEALRHSYRIASINENICIAQTGITRAAAEFDSTAFVESKFVRTSVPTGSQLEAGNNADRLREENFTFSGGVRRKTQTGANFKLGQEIGLRDSSSQFFTPENQGNSRLTISFNQPLLNGAGKAYNRSLIVLAKLDTQIASDDATTSIQNHLLSVQESMWNLYYHRASLLLRIQHLGQATSIHQWLVNRQELDSLDSQVKRAEAAVATRKSELARAVTAIRNAEDQLRTLVNSPGLTVDQTVEIIPARPPSLVFHPVSFEDAIVTALQQRSEMNEVARELDSARVKLNVARNDYLPMLDLVLESYVSGLRGNSDIGRSWADQFSVGEPSYTGGFVFELPVGRRAATANVYRRRAELRKLGSRLSETIAKLHAEVAAAVREVETSHRELGARYVAMVSAREYVKLISMRWRELPGDGYSANSMLEDLLDAQDRLLLEEVGFARAQIDYAFSTTRLKRATGTLLQVQPMYPPR